MRSFRALQRNSRQIYWILTAQRSRYHDLSRAAVIGTPAQNSSEFQVRIYTLVHVKFMLYDSSTQLVRICYPKR